MFQLIVIGLLVWVFIKFKSKIRKLFDSISSSTSIKYTPVQRDYSPAVIIMEHTRFTVVPKLGMYAPQVLYRYAEVTRVLLKDISPTDTFTGNDLWTILNSSDASREILTLFKPFFEEYRTLDIKLPMSEYLHYIKGGLNVN